jgi:malonyl-CoA/methylmalonyl-CoA synthetase
MLTHANLESNARTLVALWRFSQTDMLLHALPIYHTHGLFTATNTVLMAGASMIFLPRFDLDEILAELPHATVMMGVPTFYTRLLADRRFGREAVAHMRLFVAGSAPLLAGTHRDFFARTGHAILERYGMTETNMISSNPYDAERVPGTVGFPLPGVEVRIADRENGATLSADKTGMIEVRGPNVCRGYWKKPEQTAQSFRPDGFFITGDLGTFDTKGYLRIVGRAKDLVISGGLNIYPKEIEQEIDALPGIVESAVIGLPHPDLGEAVTAVVVRDPDGAIGEPEMLVALASRLARYKLPRRIIFAGDLPRNAMGKVQKSLLRDAHRSLYCTSG